MDELEASLLLTNALAEEHGLVVECSDPEKLRQQLYRIRKQQPIYETLSFMIDPANHTTHLMIVKTNAAD